MAEAEIGVLQPQDKAPLEPQREHWPAKTLILGLPISRM